MLIRWRWSSSRYFSVCSDSDRKQDWKQPSHDELTCLSGLWLPLLIHFSLCIQTKMWQKPTSESRNLSKCIQSTQSSVNMPEIKSPMCWIIVLNECGSETESQKLQGILCVTVIVFGLCATVWVMGFYCDLYKKINSRSQLPAVEHQSQREQRWVCLCVYVSVCVCVWQWHQQYINLLVSLCPPTNILPYNEKHSQTLTHTAE